MSRRLWVCPGQGCMVWLLWDASSWSLGSWGSHCCGVLVYRIPCGTCPKVYIGQTGRTLEHRLKEHKRALTSGNVSQSAVAEHAMDESHTIKWEEAEVVNHHPFYRQRCALEAWHIRTERHKMNRDEGPLPPVYNPLVHLSRLHPPH